MQAVTAHTLPFEQLLQPISTVSSAEQPSCTLVIDPLVCVPIIVLVLQLVMHKKLLFLLCLMTPRSLVELMKCPLE